MNLKKPLIIILSSIGVSLLLFKIWFPDFYLLKRKPNLIKGLPSEIAVAEEKFKIRVQNLFPQNTLDGEIKRELSNQGFNIKNYQSKKIASYKTYSFFCDSVWLITWGS